MVKYSIGIFSVFILLLSCKKKDPQPQPVDNYLKITVQPTYLNNGQQNVQHDGCTKGWGEEARAVFLLQGKVHREPAQEKRAEQRKS